MYFGDIKSADLIMSSSSPSEQKSIGRRVIGFNQETYVYLFGGVPYIISFSWDEVSYDVMKDGLLLKFGQHLHLKKALLESGDASLVEASPTDRRWGIGEICRTV